MCFLRKLYTEFYGISQVKIKVTGCFDVKSTLLPLRGLFSCEKYATAWRFCQCKNTLNIPVHGLLWREKYALAIAGVKKIRCCHCMACSGVKQTNKQTNATAINIACPGVSSDVKNTLSPVRTKLFDPIKREKRAN